MSRTIEEKDRTQDVALYISKSGLVLVDSVSLWIEKSEDYVRVSEPVTVTFNVLPDEEIVTLRVKGLDAKIEKARAELTRKIAELTRKIADLTDQKNRLLAITHQEV